jgi:hypothetical protein
MLHGHLFWLSNAFDGLENCAGITTAKVHVRVRIDANQTVNNFLHSVQDYVVNSVPHELYGVKNMTEILPELASSILNPSSQVITRQGPRGRWR